MLKYIAILRGINVGGKRKLLMADLRLLFEELSFINIKTYIQSGNVIFESIKNLSALEIETIIEQEIDKEFGFDVPVIVRSVDELEQVFLNNPFLTNKDITKLYVTFLKEKPLAEDILHTETYQFENDEFIIIDKEVFIYCEGKYHQTKINNSFFEKKLKVTTTTRNWRTVSKLVNLSSI